MKIDDCLPVMTKRPLSRIVDSIVKENLPKGDEERLREQIRQNVKELCSPARIQAALDLGQTSRSSRILTDAILNQLLEFAGPGCTPENLYDLVRKRETEIIELAKAEDALGFSDPAAIQTYRVVLHVALKDGDVTPDEFALLERLRKHLGISRLEHRVMEAQLGVYPKTGNALHSFEEFTEATRFLQQRGILFYLNKADPNALLVLPEEIAENVGKLLGFEMPTEAQILLHEALTTQQLRAALQANGLPLSGTKQERSERLIRAGVRPSEVVDALDNTERGDLCRKLPGVKVSGSKHERLERIIEHFANLTIKDVEETGDPRAQFYAYLEEFARRDSQNLYQTNLISSDRDIDRGFELGTSYLFEQKLGAKLEDMPGSDHADGCTRFPNGELLLWDNKSTKSPYSFPISHIDQFKRYIRSSAERVNVFLIVVPDYTDGVRLQAMKLRHDTGTDTDIAIITAEDLKFVAESWPKYSKSGVFSLEVLNTTGILDRKTLDERMQILLS